MLKLNTFAIILTLLMMKQVWVCLLLLAGSLGSDSRKTSHRIVGPVKKSKVKMIKYKNRWWKIKTRKKHSESGRDYQNYDDSKDETEGIMLGRP